MFDSLDEQMKHDDAVENTPRQRFMKWVIITFAAVAAFGGLYFAIQVSA